MGTIKDITDLLTKLIGNIKDRKFASELREIQTMVNTLQSENTVLQEKNSALMTENSNLKTENFKLKQAIEDYKKKTFNQNKPQVKPEFKLDNITEQILRHFFDTGKELPIQNFISLLSLDISTVKYHIDILSKKRFIRLPSKIRVSFKANSRLSETWEITEEGRKYVIEQMSK
ncbi:MAG: hypothetical protein SCARUB_04711 [Candidatus Scalindua rubra]|uniref:Uncharacterized protein n=1 Tax=Candidatus Scalindua rubra TaxID=1872076 RepID=A0A1E3X3H9_9BACT|nr:MAG: hypothetical protein SCARUB_04711 [Candidatus Scalindua rubra]